MNETLYLWAFVTIGARFGLPLLGLLYFSIFRGLEFPFIDDQGIAIVGTVHK